jgi:hypothetical protein
MSRRFCDCVGLASISNEVGVLVPRSFRAWCDKSLCRLALSCGLHFVCRPNRLPMADAAWRLSLLEYRVWPVSKRGPQWRLGDNSRPSPGTIPSGCRKEKTMDECRHSRQPVGADSRGWPGAWRRWCQLAGSGWRLLSADEISASLPTLESAACRLSLWPQRIAGAGIADVRMGLASGAAANGDQEIYGGVQAVDRGADLRLAGPLQAPHTRLRTNAKVQRSGHVPRHD